MYKYQIQLNFKRTSVFCGSAMTRNGFFLICEDDNTGRHLLLLYRVERDSKDTILRNGLKCEAVSRRNSIMSYILPYMAD